MARAFRWVLAAALAIAVAYGALALWLMHSNVVVAVLTATSDAYRIPAWLGKAYLRFGRYDLAGGPGPYGQPLLSFVCAGYGSPDSNDTAVLEVAELLVRKGANPDARHRGYTVLQEAVLFNEPELVRHLISLGAHPELRLEAPGRPQDDMTTLEFARYLQSKGKSDFTAVIAVLSERNTGDAGDANAP